MPTKLATLAAATSGAGGATAAVARHAEVAAQILERAGTALGGLADLAVGDGLADTDIHPGSPEIHVNANNSYLTLMRTIVNNNFSQRLCFPGFVPFPTVDRN